MFSCLQLFHTLLIYNKIILSCFPEMARPTWINIYAENSRYRWRLAVHAINCCFKAENTHFTHTCFAIAYAVLVFLSLNVHGDIEIKMKYKIHQIISGTYPLINSLFRFHLTCRRLPIPTCDEVVHNTTHFYYQHNLVKTSEKVIGVDKRYLIGTCYLCNEIHKHMNITTIQCITICDIDKFL